MIGLIEAVQLTSFGRQTNHQCVTIVNIHHIAFTRATAVWTGNFCCYHEHYHVGARPLYDTGTAKLHRKTLVRLKGSKRPEDL